LSKMRAGRANPQMFDGLVVDYYGSPTPIAQVGNISVADARTLTIQPWEKNMLQPIERSIIAANLGVTPQNDGAIIRIFLPPLTEERRREIVKRVQGEGESSKVAGKAWLPEVGETQAETYTLLSDNLAKLKAHFHPVENLDQAISLVKDLAQKKNWKNIAYHKNELVTPVALAIDGNAWAVEDSFTKDQLEAADVGLTSCVSIVAQFGAILVSSETSGGRGLSILPPVHVVIAKADQVVPDLAACFEQINVQFKGKMPSMLSFITGPSRTGDIERILVLGAHGPKELYLILVR